MKQLRFFVSYSRIDKNFAEQLVTLLREIYIIWFDDNLVGGQTWWNEILHRIGECDILIYLLSEDSVKSPFCLAELAEARRLHKQILPIRIKPESPIPTNLSQIHIADMSEGINPLNFSKLQAAILNLTRTISSISPTPLSPFPTPLPQIETDQHINKNQTLPPHPQVSIEYAEGMLRLDDREIEEIAQHLPKVLRIRVKQRLRSGQSGSEVLLVDVDPVADAPLPLPVGPHYLKIHADDSKAKSIEWVNNLAQSAIGRAMPEVIDHVVYNERLAVLYKPAQKKITAQAVASLGRLINENATLAAQNLEGLCNLLKEWNSQIQIDTRLPRDLLVDLLGPRRISGEESIQKRVERDLNIPDKPLRLLFGGELILPNPLAFLSYPEIWKRNDSEHNEAIPAITVPLGNIHGDLHADNLLCQRQIQNYGSQPCPDVLDFATYAPNKLIFFDLAYLEFDILLRICSPRIEDNRRALLMLIPYLMAEINLNKPPPGGVVAHNVVNFVRPLRATAYDFFGQRADDFEIAYWSAAVAVGLNFARKRTATVKKFDNLLGMIYAASALKRILDSLDIDYTSEEVPSILWINRKWNEES